MENFDFSDCKAGKSAFVEGSRSMDYHIDESMEYHYTEGDKLYLVHRNVYFNCCQPENNLQVETSLVGDSIIVNEYEKKPGQCRCICPYDMECTLGPLHEKMYWVIVKKEGEKFFRFLIDFDKGLEGELKAYE